MAHITSQKKARINRHDEHPTFSNKSPLTTRLNSKNMFITIQIIALHLIDVHMQNHVRRYPGLKEKNQKTHIGTIKQTENATDRTLSSCVTKNNAVQNTMHINCPLSGQAEGLNLYSKS